MIDYSNYYLKALVQQYAADGTEIEYNLYNVVLYKYPTPEDVLSEATSPYTAIIPSGQITDIADYLWVLTYREPAY